MSKEHQQQQNQASGKQPRKQNYHKNRNKEDLTPKFTEKLVLGTTDENYHQLIGLTSRYAKTLVEGKERDKVSTHMLRNIFGEAKRQTTAAGLWKLEVKLAYLAGRNESNYKVKKLTEMLTRLIRKTTDENLENFKDFFTALVAYHKYHEKFSSKKNRG
ncbi:MAG: type III-A CRISPR-associated protein Csm2 [Bacteroidetes bacterium]|nr:MAG: type III-A CRISPR-associated protein Csm2 [Bacteroidota bacterium]